MTERSGAMSRQTGTRYHSCSHPGLGVSRIPDSLMGQHSNRRPGIGSKRPQSFSTFQSKSREEVGG